MISPSPKPTYVLVFLFAIFLQFSCSKDSDLLADYVMQDSQSALLDIKVFANTNKPVIIAPLNEGANAIITEVTEPSDGTAEVNPNNTITYTPEPNTTGTDNFSVSAEVTTSNNTVTTNTSEINVTIVDSKDPVSGANVHYVTTNGKSINNGATETNAWDISKAFNSAKAGDIIYIKAGNYGNKNLVVKNSGTATAPIKFIGYTNIPGNLVSDKGSTFTYGDQLDAGKMPLIRSFQEGKNNGIIIEGNFVETHNFQVRGYAKGIVVNGDNVLLKNIITYETGPQKVNTPSGKGLIIFGNNGLVEDCFDYNSVSQGITLSGSKNTRVNYSAVYCDNTINPGGYYIALLAGTDGAIIENCVLWKTAGLSHGGHGYVLKDKATNNIIRNSVATNTGIEVNFTGVAHNTFENIKIYGDFSRTPSDYSATINVRNGAHHNAFKDIYLEDVRYAVVFTDIDDGYAAADADRDAVQGGSYNTFTNIEANGSRTGVLWGAGITSAMYSDNNEFYNCTFKDVNSLFAVHSSNKNNKFVNCKVENANTYVLTYEGYKLDMTLENCNFKNVKFALPQGTNITGN